MHWCQRLKRNRIFYLLLVASLSIFSFFIKIIITQPCLKLGYSLCAVIGEDFFALYQAIFNFINGNFIYGQVAEVNLFAPFFMTFKYFPITPAVFSPFFMFIHSATAAYYFYTFLCILFHIFSIYGIFLIYKKTQQNIIFLGISIFLWLSNFHLLSEWRMGQYNNLAANFMLWTIVFILYSDKLKSSIFWILSLITKPISILCVPFFIKDRNKYAIVLFILLFVLFSFFYLQYFQLNHGITAFKLFFDTLTISGDRSGWQIHYIDNFSVKAFLGELFYDHSPALWNLSYNIFTYIIFALYFLVTIFLQFNTPKIKIYYLLLGLITLTLGHAELWESWLTIYSVIVVTLLLLSKKLWEKIFIIINGLLLSTPTIFFLWSNQKTATTRFWLIGLKVIPQILLYILIIFIIATKLKNNNIFHKKLATS